MNAERVANIARTGGRRDFAARCAFGCIVCDNHDTGATAGIDAKQNRGMRRTRIGSSTACAFVRTNQAVAETKMIAVPGRKWDERPLLRCG